ncbi:D-sedoheptulose 7-phosphate isomerase [Dyadobacter jejuensis]|uniref:D-sedoheptulose 7-phosphate isomerase n=1 Tax=Dyadobacter jejuensis TaxID=1082580 RepID=A0A316AS95_9BACT|nr:SIS domain-containing protein [Dyadobacter jejuensis]PWJ60388.1 D-sedoheptulose 7-phosphate isomerase [Dyadobacter jejuensis]
MTNQLVDGYISQLKETLDKLDRKEVVQFAEVIENARQNGNKVFIFGNGGSGSTASHFACDINKGVSLGLEKRHRIIALTDNIPTMLAYSNDLSYDEVFVEQLKNFLEPGDVVVGISGSGNSKNVLKAIEYANGQNNLTVGLTGFGGGKLREMAKMSVNANFNDMQISEDIHMILVHLLMKMLPKAEVLS